MGTHTKIQISSALITTAGVGMIIGGAFLDAMAKDALILAGSAITTLALSVFLASMRCNSNLLIFLLPTLALGYGAVHVGITPLLQEAGLDLASTIAVKCAVSGVLGFIAGYLCVSSVYWPEQFKESFLKIRYILPWAMTAAVCGMTATVLPEIIANAIGVQGDVGIAFEVLIGASLIAAVFTISYCAITYYKSTTYEKAV